MLWQMAPHCWPSWQRRLWQRAPSCCRHSPAEGGESRKRGSTWATKGLSTSSTRWLPAPLAEAGRSSSLRRSVATSAGAASCSPSLMAPRSTPWVSRRDLRPRPRPPPRRPVRPPGQRPDHLRRAPVSAPPASGRVGGGAPAAPPAAPSPKGLPRGRLGGSLCTLRLRRPCIAPSPRPPSSCTIPPRSGRCARDRSRSCRWSCSWWRAWASRSTMAMGSSVSRNCCQLRSFHTRYGDLRNGGADSWHMWVAHSYEDMTSTS
mmetsp:Transcript_23315/g.75441  ORF Transcript_23315/g.75441 Transcript_23315/m.75441 type:complete len:261 (-) Transcript_23315:46-828(-)